jgi:hypothetical protein
MGVSGWIESSVARSRERGDRSRNNVGVNHTMLSFLKRAVLSVTLAASMLTSVLTAAPAMAAGTAALTFNPSSTTVGVGATFSVPVMVNISGGSSLGDQFGVTYDPNVLTLNSVTDGTFYSGYASGVSGCSSINANPWFPPTSPGTTQVGADSLLGAACGAGATGTGTLATLSFTGKAGVNAITALSFTGVSPTGTQINGITTVTVTSLSITVGTPPAPKLTISNQTTTAVSGTPTQFNLSFQVNNTGTANSTATTAAVAVTGATPTSASVNVAAINFGANSGALSAGPFTLNSGSTLANVTITVDAAGTTGGPATATTAYQYSAISANGNTTLSANLAATLILTAPANLANLVLTPGQTNTYPDGNLNVKSNVNYSVTVADATAANNGHFTEYNPGTGMFVPGGAQLIQALQIQSPPAALITISGAPQAYVSGLAANQDPNIGANFPTTFSQYVGFNDKPVKAPDVYYEIVVFAASGTF